MRTAVDILGIVPLSSQTSQPLQSLQAGQLTVNDQLQKLSSTCLTQIDCQRGVLLQVSRCILLHVCLNGQDRGPIYVHCLCCLHRPQPSAVHRISCSGVP